MPGIHTQSQTVQERVDWNATTRERAGRIYGFGGRSRKTFPPPNNTLGGKQEATGGGLRMDYSSPFH